MSPTQDQPSNLSVPNGTEICNLERLCVDLGRILNFQQGHIEIHYHQGKPKEITRVDKSIKLGR